MSSNFPGVYHDEYCHAYCAEHHREDCHICCMSFSMINEQIDDNPSDRDVGKFIDDASLIDWHAKMKVNMPQVFPEEDKVFGDNSSQHPYGTKLLAHFDEDPNKSMHATVLGSRWKRDDFASGFPGMSSPFVNGLEPMYVILINGELSQIGLMDAHMGDDGGWKVVGHNSEVNARLDALERAHQTNLNAHSTGEDSVSEITEDEFEDGIASLNHQIRRTVKTCLQNDFDPKPWNQKANGEFFKQWLMFSFSPSELDQMLGKGAVNESIEIIGKKIKGYEVNLFILEHSQTSFYTRLVMAKMVAYFSTDDQYGAIIVVNKRQTKFQAIEFNSCRVSSDGVPCIDISYATDPEGINNVKEYLRDEKIKVVEIPNESAVILEDHLLNCVKNDGLNDVGSGLLYHVGYFVPIEILTWNDSKNDVPPNNTQYRMVPDINFGVELELSCSSGNYQKRTALNLSKHAKVDVRIQRPGGKGGIPGYSKGSTKELSSEITNKWKLVYDKSIYPNAQNPQSLMFELVSPILRGSSGVDVLSKTVTIMKDIACVRVNESMGLHVHVEAKEEDYPLTSMKSICQQFILYEGVIDSFLPYHRRTGAERCHSFFESNLLSIMESHDTLQGSIEAIYLCDTRDKLYRIMNPGVRERYHKLNLQNLSSGRQPTIEFRQHHATKDVKEVEAWVQFCALFVVNAAKVPPVQNCNTSDEEDALFESLFEYIIRCPILHGYYSKKRDSFKKRN